MWGTGDKGLTARARWRVYRDFDLRPQQIWIDGENRRGFEREWFEDAWGRYLPDLDVSC